MSRTFFRLIIVLIMFVVFVAMFDGQPMVVIGTLLVGWVGYINRVIPKVQPSWPAIVTAGVCLVGFLFLGHATARWLWRETRPMELRGSSRWRPGWTLCVAVLVVLMFVSGVAAVGITHQTAWLVRGDQKMFAPRAVRIRCMVNLREIGVAIALYANDHGGRYPDSLADLMGTGALTAQQFICPTSGLQAAPGATTLEVAAQLHEHCSYVYHGRGLTRPVSADRPIVCEPLDNHDGAGMNVLFADGHVEFFPAAEAKKVMDRLGS